MGQYKTRANSRDKLLFQATDKQLFDKQTTKEMKSLFTFQKLPGKRGGGERGGDFRWTGGVVEAGEGGVTCCDRPASSDLNRRRRCDCDITT